MDNYLSSVKNSCRLLKLFLESEKEMGVSELSRQLQLSKGAVHKLLATLESEGFIKQNQANKQYALGYTLLELGNKVIRDHNLVEFAKPYLQQLVDTTQELACLCEMDGQDAIYVDKIDSKHIIRFNVDAFRRFPLYATSAARSILAFQEEPFIDSVLTEKIRTYTPFSMKNPEEIKARLVTIRQHGYEISSDMRNVGVTAVAAPIYDSNGHVGASISVIGPSDRMKPALDSIVRLVTQTSLNISHQLGYRSK